MTIPEKIIAGRKNKGLTQEELAELTKVSIRTVQRIESGLTIPRSYTLKALAAALDIPFEELSRYDRTQNDNAHNGMAETQSLRHDTVHFLKLLCLSSFSFLVIPYVHFLIPSYFLKKRNEKNSRVLAFARHLIQVQVYWVVALLISFMVALFYNLVLAPWLSLNFHLSYLWLFFALYSFNIVIILVSFMRIRTLGLATTQPA